MMIYDAEALLNEKKMYFSFFLFSEESILFFLPLGTCKTRFLLN